MPWVLVDSTKIFLLYVGNMTTGRLILVPMCIMLANDEVWVQEDAAAGNDGKVWKIESQDSDKREEERRGERANNHCSEDYHRVTNIDAGGSIRGWMM